MARCRVHFVRIPLHILYIEASSAHSALRTAPPSPSRPGAVPGGPTRRSGEAVAGREVEEANMYGFTNEQVRSLTRGVRVALGFGIATSITANVIHSLTRPDLAHLV